MQIIKETDPLILEKTGEVLRNGGSVVYPTETCYGIGVDATNANAVDRILEFKKRPEGSPISVAVSDKGMAEMYVKLNSIAEHLYDKFLPGPVTIISKSKGLTDKRLESENQTLGVRIPAFDITQNIIKEFGRPLTTTAATPYGSRTPYSIEDILNSTTDRQKNLIDLIIDAGTLPHNPPSTVIDTTTEELRTYRKGVIDPTKISKEYLSNSVEETESIGAEVLKENMLRLKNEPLIILLEGDLGSGKTHLTKGIAKYLNIEATIKSPTYTYIEEYPYDLSQPEEPAFERSQKQGTLYHIDAWRIENENDLKMLGFHEWLKPHNVIVIEWASVIEELSKDFLKDLKMLKIFIETLDENSRKITVSN